MLSVTSTRMRAKSSVIIAALGAVCGLTGVAVAEVLSCPTGFHGFSVGYVRQCKAYEFGGEWANTGCDAESSCGLRGSRRFQFLADARAFEIGQVIDEQPAFQMVAFMLDTDG